MVHWYILLSTLALAFVAFAWSSKVGLNLIIKMIFIGLTVVGAICTAATFGVTPA